MISSSNSFLPLSAKGTALCSVGCSFQNLRGHPCFLSFHYLSSHPINKSCWLYLKIYQSLAWPPVWSPWFLSGPVTYPHWSPCFQSCLTINFAHTCQSELGQDPHTLDIATFFIELQWFCITRGIHPDASPLPSWPYSLPTSLDSPPILCLTLLHSIGRGAHRHSIPTSEPWGGSVVPSVCDSFPQNRLMTHSLTLFISWHKHYLFREASLTTLPKVNLSFIIFIPCFAVL